MHNWNYGKWISYTLKSMVEQDVSHDLYEIIAIDKASTDDSENIIDDWIKKYPDLIRKFIIPYTHQSDAIDQCIDKMISPSIKFICVLNSDDCFLPNHIKLHYETMLNDSEIAVTHSDGMVCDENMNFLNIFYTKSIEILKRTGENTIFQPSTMIRLSKLKEIGLFPKDFIHCYDFATWSKMAMNGMKFKIINATTTRYRLHNTSMFRTFRAENELEMARVKKEILKL